MKTRIEALAMALCFTMVLFAGTAFAEVSPMAYAKFSMKSTKIFDRMVEVVVSAELFDGASVNGLNLDLAYDENLTVDSIVEGTAFGDALLVDSATQDSVRMIWDGANAYAETKAELFTVVFSLNSPLPDETAAFYLSCLELYSCSISEEGLMTMDIPNNCSDNPIKETVWMGESLVITPQETTLIVGQFEKLSANKAVSTWSSSNGDVAQVDDNGRIQALTSGTAIVTATGGRNGQETAQAIVHVLPRAVLSISIKTPPTKTVYKSGESLNLSGLTVDVLYNNGDRETISSEFTAQGDLHTVGSNAVTVSYGGQEAVFFVIVNSSAPETVTSEIFNVKDGYLSKIPIGTTVGDLIAGLNERQYLRVLDRNGNTISSGIAATGQIVELVVDGIVRQSIVVVVTGDVNGDGTISISDMLAVKSKLLKKSELAGSYAKAADTNGDEAVSITDFIQLKAHILKKSMITAR